MGFLYLRGIWEPVSNRSRAELRKGKEKRFSSTDAFVLPCLCLSLFIPSVIRTNPARHKAVREARNVLQKACCLVVESRC